MGVIRTLTLAASLVVCSLLAFTPAHAQVDVNISVDVEPPPLPVYDQPPIPEPGYLWVPGYWAWDDDTGYYWVPGTWVLPPEPEFAVDARLLVWGWDDGVYVFTPAIGDRRSGSTAASPTASAMTASATRAAIGAGARFTTTTPSTISGGVRIVNVYSKTVVVNNVTNVSFNGGAHGTTARPTPEQIAAGNQRHIPATAEQTRHAEVSSA